MLYSYTPMCHCTERFVLFCPLEMLDNLYNRSKKILNIFSCNASDIYYNSLNQTQFVYIKTSILEIP